jgi:DHA1 family bicyclomycin/chloramphenicol resistance-like MFS transporter
MMLVMGVVPMFARLVGGQIFAVFGGHAIFWLLTGFGVICLLVVLLRLPESNLPDRRIRAGLVDQLRGFGEILSNRMALGCILSGGFAFAGMFPYISGTPFVYIQYFGVPAEHYGFLFGLNIVGMMAWAALNARLVARRGARCMMRLVPSSLPSA